MKYFLIALVLALISVVARNQLATPPAEQPPAVPDSKVTRVNSDGWIFSRLCTADHDEHRFVLAEGQGTAVLHHPDCPCGKLEKKP